MLPTTKELHKNKHLYHDCKRVTGQRCVGAPFRTIVFRYTYGKIRWLFVCSLVLTPRASTPKRCWCYWCSLFSVQAVNVVASACLAPCRCAVALAQADRKHSPDFPLRSPHTTAIPPASHFLTVFPGNSLLRHSAVVPRLSTWLAPASSTAEPPRKPGVQNGSDAA